MSDRWGPSEDCRACGQPESYGHLDEYGRCRWCAARNMTVEPEEESEEKRLYGPY